MYGSDANPKLKWTIRNSSSEVRRTLVYVLQNAHKHGVRLGAGMPGRSLCDARSSAVAFDGWREHDVGGAPDVIPWLFPAGTWLATTGWRRLGTISIDEHPRRPPPSPAR